MRHFTELKVWRSAHELFLRIHREALRYPPIERYVLASQLRRAALSVPTNIVEGSKRISQVEFARYLNVSQASLAETEYLLMVSHDLEYLATDVYESLMAELLELAKMLHGLRSRVEETASHQALSSQLPALSSQPSPPR